MTTIRELGYQYEQDSVVYSTSNSSEAWLYFTTLFKIRILLEKGRMKVISLIKGVKKLRLLTTSILTKIEKAPTPLNS
ncbi:hypothetical protein ACLF8N_06120 [Helicobacter pylori]